jgi:hypothetical protein
MKDQCHSCAYRNLPHLLGIPAFHLPAGRQGRNDAKKEMIID